MSVTPIHKDEYPTMYVAEAFMNRRAHWERWLFRIDARHLKVGDTIMYSLFYDELPTVDGEPFRRIWVLTNSKERKVKDIKVDERFQTVSIKIRHYLFNYWHTILHPEEQVFMPAENTRGAIYRDESSIQLPRW